MELEKLFYRYHNMLFRICLVTLCNEADAQDAVQDTFCRYLEQKKKFADEEHEKAWLIRVAVNICRDIQRKKARHPQVTVESLSDYYETKEEGYVLEELMNLSEKLKTVIYLYYIEGYPIKEIGAMLNLSENAVKKRLQRGRESLKQRLGKE